MNSANSDKDPTTPSHAVEMMKSIMRGVKTITDAQRLQEQHIVVITERVEESYRTLRGFNGNEGLVAQVVSIRKELDEVHEKLDKIWDTLTSREKGEDEHLTFKWIGEKFGLPITIAVILYFLLTVLPQIGKLITGP